MGASYSYASREADEANDRAEDKALRAKLDCKDFAQRFAADDASLTVVRGYVVLPTDGFTEHWWCQTKRGVIVDVTSLAGCRGEYIPLKERADVMYSMCSALVGACEVRPRCEWCETRAKIEKGGVNRANIKVDALRIMVDRLWADNARLCSELAKSGAALEAAERRERRAAEEWREAERKRRGEWR